MSSSPATRGLPAGAASWSTSPTSPPWADGRSRSSMPSGRPARRKPAPVLVGLHAASQVFGVPIVGGHTNTRTDRGQLSVAILGRAKRLLTSFDARPQRPPDCGDRSARPLSRAVLELGSRDDAPPGRLRGDLEILPAIAEAGLARAAKDISQGGIVGTAMMLAECSARRRRDRCRQVPRPDGVALERWLQTFPSYGYLLAARADERGRRDRPLCRARHCGRRHRRSHGGRPGEHHGWPRDARPSGISRASR